MQKKITATRGDDLGMQVYSRLYAIKFCEEIEGKYVHTPLKTGLQEYEDFFNLSSVSANVFQEKVIDIGGFAKPTTVAKNHPVFIPVFFDQKFKTTIRKAYFLNPKKNSEKFINSKGIKIAIHVRKSKLFGKRQELRNTPNFFVESVVNKINHVFGGQKVSIHIYSNQNICFNVKEKVIFNKNLRLFTHYKSDLKESIHDMIEADFLFKYGISTFSGICALYRYKPTFFEFPLGMNYLLNAFKSESSFLYNRPIEFYEPKCFGDLFPKGDFKPKFHKDWIETI